MHFMCTMGNIEIKEDFIKFMEKRKNHSSETDSFVQLEIFP